jgi:methylglutaconyl-CoA hydratase
MSGEPAPSSEASSLLLLDVREGIARITLNRPDKRNALNGELVEALASALAETADDSRVRVVLLSGAGKDFCSGADLAELEKMADAGPDASLADARRMGEMFLAMRDHPRPIVAAVRGRALAGGCGLATACDLVLAEEGAEFGFPEVHLGFVPAMVMTLLRRKVTEGRAFELAVRGERIPAFQAQELGLVNRVFPVGAFEAEVESYVTSLAKLPSGAVARTKALLYELDDLDLAAGIARGVEVNVAARMSDECRRGVRAFLERSK